MRSLTSCSVRRYRVEGAIPSPGTSAGAAELVRKLRDRRFLPLKAHEERSYGWVSAENLLVTDFDAETLVRGGRAVFALRIDRRRVNGRLLRARLELETKARTKAAGRISRDERQRMRKELHDELLKQTSPSVEAHGVLYDPRTKTLSALTLSRPANDALRALFRDTFGATLAPLTPWLRGSELLEGAPAGRAFDALQRTEFVPGASDAGFAGRREVLAAALPAADRVTTVAVSSEDAS